MKKQLIAAIFIILMVAGALVISSLPSATVIINETELNQAHETDNGLIFREIVVSPGDKFEIKLFAFRGAGMFWSGRVENSNIVKQDGNKYTGSSPISVGGPGMEKWVFNALEKGETTIIMTYGSVGLTGPPIANIFTLKVTVK